MNGRGVTRRGFTLTELIMVIVIAMVLVAIAVPLMSALTSQHRGEGGVQTVSSAVNAARIFSHRLEQQDMGGAGYPFPEGARYDGTAVLFTPSREIRLVINDQRAAMPGDPEQNPDLYLENNGLLGYRDIADADYIGLPRGTGIAGVHRGPNMGLQVIAPPFAIRFNEHGQLSPGLRKDPTTGEGYIYYRAQADRQEYQVTSGRFSDYDPDDYNPTIVGRATLNQSNGVYDLPFDAIETVTGVLLFDANDFRAFLVDNGHTWQSPEAQEWLLTEDQNGDLVNATALYFNPSSGFVLREN